MDETLCTTSICYPCFLAFHSLCLDTGVTVVSCERDSKTKYCMSLCLATRLLQFLYNLIKARNEKEMSQNNVIERYPGRKGTVYPPTERVCVCVLVESELVATCSHR